MFCALLSLLSQRYRAILSAAFLAVGGLMPAHSQLIDIKAFDNGVLVGEKTGVGMLQLVVSCTNCLPPASNDPAFSFFVVDASSNGGIIAPDLSSYINLSSPKEAGHVIIVDVTQTGLSGMQSQTVTSLGVDQTPVPLMSPTFESVALNGVVFQSFSAPNGVGQSGALFKVTNGPFNSIEQEYSFSFPTGFPDAEPDLITTIAGIGFKSLGVVPEPSTWAMILLGFAGLGFLRYRRTRTGKPETA